MKKVIAILAALALLAGCVALADAAQVGPASDVNMETYGTEDCTVHVAIDASAIEADGDELTYLVYGMDTYTAEAIRGLQAGDGLYINGEQMTVETVEESENGFDVNGGFIGEETEGEGATLVYVEGSTEVLCSTLYDGMLAYTLQGEVTYPFADEVTVTTYKWEEDGDFAGNYDVQTLPAAEVKAYLGTTGVSYDYSNTTLTLKDGKVTEIKVEWAPNV